MKNPIHIGGALFVGTFIVLGALYVRDHVATNTGGEIVVLPAPERTYIESKDSDGDGIKDWEEDIQNQFGFSDTATVDLSQTATYTPPTTLTGKFSVAFLQDYLEGKMHGEDFNDPNKFIGTAIAAIDSNTKAYVHTPDSLTLTDSNPETMRAYGNNVMETVQKYSFESQNEGVILQEALEKNSPELLEQLKPIAEAYTNIVNDSSKLAVPSELKEEHIQLLNAYEQVLFDIKAMENAYTDPLLALARVRAYKDHVTQLKDAFLEIKKVLLESDVSYTNIEPGIFIYQIQ